MKKEQPIEELSLFLEKKNVSRETFRRKISVCSEKIKGFDSRTEISESEHLGKVIRCAGCLLF